jgi:anaerobic glycerol-3-phosphate dehydrogenase
MKTLVQQIRLAMDALMMQRSLEAQERGADNNIIEAGQKALETLENSSGTLLLIKAPAPEEYRDADH